MTDNSTKHNFSVTIMTNVITIERGDEFRYISIPENTTPSQALYNRIEEIRKAIGDLKKDHTLFMAAIRLLEQT